MHIDTIENNHNHFSISIISKRTIDINISYATEKSCARLTAKKLTNHLCTCELSIQLGIIEV